MSHAQEEVWLGCQNLIVSVSCTEHFNTDIQLITPIVAFKIFVEHDCNPSNEEAEASLDIVRPCLKKIIYIHYI
jgi:hypothetical protein